MVPFHIRQVASCHFSRRRCPPFVSVFIRWHLRRYGTECLRPVVTMPFSGDVILGQMAPDLNLERSIPNAIMASKPFQLFWLVVIVLMMEKVETLGRVGYLSRV